MHFKFTRILKELSTTDRNAFTLRVPVSLLRIKSQTKVVCSKKVISNYFIVAQRKWTNRTSYPFDVTAVVLPASAETSNHSLLPFHPSLFLFDRQAFSCESRRFGFRHIRVEVQIIYYLKIFPIIDYRFIGSLESLIVRIYQYFPIVYRCLELQSTNTRTLNCGCKKRSLWVRESFQIEGLMIECDFVSRKEFGHRKIILCSLKRRLGSL